MAKSSTPTFTCHAEGFGSRRLTAFDAETAAEVYADDLYHEGDRFDELTVEVTQPNGIRMTFTVEVEPSVSFCATEVVD